MVDTNSSLHQWPRPDKSNAIRAVQTNAAATRLVVDVMGLSFEAGRAVLKPGFHEYLMNPVGIASTKTKFRRKKPTTLVHLAMKVFRNLTQP